MLSALVMVTRPASEIADIDEAARWVGLPEYQTGEKLLRVVVLCESSADRQAFLDHLGATVIDHKGSDVWSIYWPLRTVGDDRRSLKFGPEAAP